MATRLKVYATRIGFHDVIVAAPNQKAALEAWDVREDLFAQGAAAPTDDRDATKAALAHPGVVLSRPIGGSAYSLQPEAPKAPPPAQRDPPKATKRAPPKPEPDPDRTALDLAERALDDIEAEIIAAEDVIRRERMTLESRAAAERRKLETKKRQLERERDQALSAYRKSGGD